MSESETHEQQQKPKREGDFDDFNLIAKKSKIEKVNENEEEAARAQIMHKQIDFVEIEADAAEDKGSRHTMEDASVVLVDASSDSPPNLRLSFFFRIKKIELNSLLLLLLLLVLLLLLLLIIFLVCEL